MSFRADLTVIADAPTPLRQGRRSTLLNRGAGAPFFPTGEARGQTFSPAAKLILS